MTATTEHKTATVGDLRDSLAAAQHRQRTLIAESQGLPGELRRASRQAARQKAQAARSGDAGEALATTAADLDIEAMRRRESELPFKLWASRLTVLEIARDLLQAELEEARCEQARTGPIFDRARRDLALAEKAHGDAYAAHSAAAACVQGLQVKVRDAKREAADLVESYPGA